MMRRAIRNTHRRLSIEQHLLIGVAMAIVTSTARFVARRGGDTAQRQELAALKDYLLRLRCRFDADFFQDNPAETGITSAIGGPIYYDAAGPLSGPEIYLLLEFEHRVDALNLGAKDRPEAVKRALEDGRLEPILPPRRISKSPPLPKSTAELVDQAITRLTALREALAADEDNGNKSQRE